MNDDLMAGFAKMREYTAALRGLMTAAGQRAPRSSEGTDRTGAVWVELDHEGLPVSFRVDQGWARRLRPEEFAGAVLEAGQVALSARMRAWTEGLVEDGWQDRVERARTEQSDKPAGQVPVAFGGPVEPVTPRPLGEVAEDMFAAFDRLDASATTPAGNAATGTDDSGGLTITLSPTGMTSCVADDRWVAGRTAAQLMNALSGALRSARTALAEAASRTTPTSGLDGLFAEAMALLNDPDRLIDRKDR